MNDTSDSVIRSSKPKCNDCGDTGYIEWDDSHGEPHSDRCHCQISMHGSPDKADLLAMAACVGRVGREKTGVQSELLKWTSATLVRLADATPRSTAETTVGRALHDEECANCGEGWSKHLTNRLICPDAAIPDGYRFAQAPPPKATGEQS